MTYRYDGPDVAIICYISINIFVYVQLKSVTLIINDSLTYLKQKSTLNKMKICIVPEFLYHNIFDMKVNESEKNIRFTFWKFITGEREIALFKATHFISCEQCTSVKCAVFSV